LDVITSPTSIHREEMSLLLLGVQGHINRMHGMEDMGLFNGDGHTWLRCDHCQGIYSGEGGIRVHQRTCQLTQVATSSEDDDGMDTDDVTVTASQVTDLLATIRDEHHSQRQDAPVNDVPVPSVAEPVVLAPGQHRIVGAGLVLGSDHEDEPIPPPPLPNPPPPEAQVDLSDLVAAFQRPLTRLHHTWRTPMRKVVVKCWQQTMESDERAAFVNFTGFLLLPGVISAMRGIKGGARPLDFLVDASQEEHPGLMIINKARALRERRALPSNNGKAPPLSQLFSSPSESTAWWTRVVCLRQPSWWTGPQPRSVGLPAPMLSLDAIREHIGRLHPKAEEQDALPEAVADPPGDELIVASVRQTVERLNVR